MIQYKKSRIRNKNEKRILIQLIKDKYPEITFKELAQFFNISSRSIRRLYNDTDFSDFESDDLYFGLLNLAKFTNR